MTYQKPEIARLGKATELILGHKLPGEFEIDPFKFRSVADAELDD